MRFVAPVLILLCTWPLMVHAADKERARIMAERKALAERYVAEEKACTNRFAVTACVDDVRARRREALAPLRERELQLDEAERRQRAQERRQAIAQREAEAASRPPAPPEPKARVRQPQLAASAPARMPKPPDDGSARTAAAARRAQDLVLRQNEAQDTQRRIEQRQAERQVLGKKSRPLPVPGAASGPGAAR